MAKLRLFQILRKSGLFPGKGSIIKALKSGLVTVDGKVTKNMTFQCNPKTREVCYDGKRIKGTPLCYFIVNKPRDWTCQRGEKYKDVRKLIPILSEETLGGKLSTFNGVSQGLWNTLFSVGRLDIPTTGLLIITNDGEFSTNVLDPKCKTPKTYKVLLKNPLSGSQEQKLKDGVEIELKDGTIYHTMGAKVKKLDNPHEILLTISEGKYRQVRKMITAVCNRCMALERVAIGGLKLEDYELNIGDWVELSAREMKGKVAVRKSS